MDDDAFRRTDTAERPAVVVPPRPVRSGGRQPAPAWVAWTVVAIACLLVWLLMRSPWGRVLKGIREDENAVRSLGKNVYAYKMQALVVGGIFGALGGVVLSLPSAVVPSVYITSLTFFVWTALLLGGARLRVITRIREVVQRARRRSTEAALREALEPIRAARLAPSEPDPDAGPLHVEPSTPTAPPCSGGRPGTSARPGGSPPRPNTVSAKPACAAAATPSRLAEA